MVSILRILSSDDLLLIYGICGNLDICVGLAFDYCVSATALDSKRLGYDTSVIVDATRSINMESDWGMWVILLQAGVGIVKKERIRKLF